MNEKIKQIFLKHGLIIDNSNFAEPILNSFNSAIIEICEEQKKECAYDVYYKSYHHDILNSKNIAE